MKLFEPIEVPILYENEYTSTSDITNVKINPDDYDSRMATFFSVTAIFPKEYSDDKCTILLCDGIEHYVRMSYNELKALILKSII